MSLENQTTPTPVAVNQPVNTPTPAGTQPAATQPLSFNDYLAQGGQSEFDKRVQKAINTAKGTWDTEQAAILKARDEDLAALQEKLKGFDGTQAEFDALKAKYENDSKAWAEKQEAQAYEFAVKSLAAEIEFTSKAAKNYFISQAISQGLKMDKDGNVLGFNDFVESYKKEDPSAIKIQEEPASTPTTPAPTFVKEGTVPKTNATPFGFLQNVAKVNNIKKE